MLAGRCGMAITWPSRAAGTSAGPSEQPIPTEIGIVELPGSPEVFDVGQGQWQTRLENEPPQVPLLGIAGRVGSVSTASRQPQAALGLLLRLSSTEWSRDISPVSPATTLYRTSQVGSAAAWVDQELAPAVAKEYGDLIRQIQRRPQSLSSPRIPGRRRYLAALGQAVQQAVAGQAEPAAALQAAAEQWQAITREIGVESQREAYVRSLGMEP
jgi:multiple sugar transport system substrate-binding protein